MKSVSASTKPTYSLRVKLSAQNMYHCWRSIPVRYGAGAGAGGTKVVAMTSSYLSDEYCGRRRQRQ
jgi:hypothetical protein